MVLSYFKFVYVFRSSLSDIPSQNDSKYCLSKVLNTNFSNGVKKKTQFYLIVIIKDFLLFSVETFEIQVELPDIKTGSFILAKEYKGELIKTLPILWERGIYINGV